LIENEYLQNGSWCNEGFLNPSDLSSSRKERNDHKREIDHKLKAVEILRFRKKLNLSQKEAGELFGGGPMAFSKYKRGEIIQSRSVDLLIRLLLSNRINIKDLKDIMEIPVRHPHE